jgi:ATP-dependent DNA ligase
MTDLVPELADLPPGLALDGELIAFGEDGLPSFPRLCRRMLAGQRAIPVMFVVFDVLAVDGESLVRLPYRARRERLEAPRLDGPHWGTTMATSDGDGLWTWVCDQGMEGVVAKRVADRYWPGERRWLKIKNRDYWRYPSEVEAALRGASRPGLYNADRVFRFPPRRTSRAFDVAANPRAAAVGVVSPVAGTSQRHE